MALADLSALTDVDFSQFDLDAAVPEITTNGHRTTLEAFLRRAATPAPRPCGSCLDAEPDAVPFVGTPDTVAQQMQDAMEQVGGDGFLISGALSRHAGPRSSTAWCPNCSAAA